MPWWAWMLLGVGGGVALVMLWIHIQLWHWYTHR